MTFIIAVHSFRGGTGKSNLSGNLAACLGLAGKRVAIFDTDLASPGVHVLFGFALEPSAKCLNDYLQEGAEIRDCAHDVTPQQVRHASGRIFLLPGSMDSDRIAKLLREGYEVEKLNDAMFAVADDLKLDFVLVDTHPGINEETLLTTAIADSLLMVMRPDSQDYLGTAVAIEVAQRLDAADIRLIVNKLPDQFDPQNVRDRVSSGYGVPLGALLPLSQDLLTLASSGLAVLEFPSHPWSEGVRTLSDCLLAELCD
jgi:MinD-like ATPase involved in chromosome partitioning or flagellar assembly